MSVSVVIPCYNEEKVIERVVMEYYKGVVNKIDGSEIIVVDGCSKDNTFKILQRLKKEFPKLRILQPLCHRNHGADLRMAYESASKDYVFQVDGDNQFKAKDFWKLYKHKDSHDFILGFREVRHDPAHRLILSRIVRYANFLLFGVWLKDSNCPFRLIKREILDGLLKLIPEDALAPNIMLSVLAKKSGIKMIEVSVIHQPRRTGSVSIANWRLIKFSLKGFKQLLKLKGVCDGI